MAYLGAGYYQVDGSAFQNQNCVCATGSTLIDRATVGRLRVTARTIRSVSGDTQGGLEYSQLADAVVRATSGDVILNVRRLTNRGQAKDLIASGRAVGFIIDCSVTRWTDRRTGTFTGIHSVVAAEYRWTRPGDCKCELERQTQHAELRVEDPGTEAGWRWWSADLLYRAAERAGGGALWSISTRDTEGVDRVARQDCNLRKHARTDSPDVGNVKLGKTYRVLVTVDGGGWRRDDGSQAEGWHRVKRGTGYAYVKGECLR